MKYIKVDDNLKGNVNITLEEILLAIRSFSDHYFWSIQFIEGAGEIEDIIGLGIVELEKYCDNSPKGFILKFDDLLKISQVCQDIEDILIIACYSEKEIPKAYTTKNWEDNCQVIISREDSSFWELYSPNSEIMHIFTKFFL
jgi:hypothetical protein